MELQKNNYEWGYMGIGQKTVFYKFYGTQLDYDFIQAWFNRDKDRIPTLSIVE